MNIYNAIMKAADHIEKNPTEFAWHSCVVPSIPHCGTPGCALGWIGSFMQAETISCVAIAMNCGGELSFYNRMDELEDHYGWTRNASDCARALRKYAEKYHATDKPERTDFIPTEIRALFNTVQA